MAILFGILALVKEPSLTDSFSSPSRLTNPPRGISLKAYFVSLTCLDHIHGPKPIANLKMVFY